MRVATAELEAEALQTVREQAVGFDHVVTTIERKGVRDEQTGELIVGETTEKTTTQRVVNLKAAEMLLRKIDPVGWTKRLDVTSKGQSMTEGKLVLLHEEDDV